MRLRVAKKIIFGGRERMRFLHDMLIVEHRVYMMTTVGAAYRRWRKWRRRQPDARAQRSRS